MLSPAAADSRILSRAQTPGRPVRAYADDLHVTEPAHHRCTVHLCGETMAAGEDEYLGCPEHGLIGICGCCGEAASLATLTVQNSAAVCRDCRTVECDDCGREAAAGEMVLGEQTFCRGECCGRVAGAVGR